MNTEGQPSGFVIVSDDRPTVTTLSSAQRDGLGQDIVGFPFHVFRKMPQLGILLSGRLHFTVEHFSFFQFA